MAKAASKSEPEPDEPDEKPITEVEITVGGHTVIVKAAESLAEVAAQALGLFEQTQLAAEKIPFGFDTSGSQIEIRPQPDLTHQGIEPFGPEED